MSTEAGSPPPGAPALTAAEIAAVIGGTVRGDPACRLARVAPLDRAGAGDLSFLAHGRYEGLFATTRATAVLVAPDLADTAGPVTTRIVVARPYDALVALLPRMYVPATAPTGVHPSAVVSPGARLGRSVAVEAGVVIGDGAAIGDRTWIGPNSVVGAGVLIGADCRLYDHVSCYPGTTLGARVVVHAGARLGSDGFGYAFSAGEHKKILHIGACIINDDVEIGANTTIDRGSVDDTVIGAGTKIDNLVHIAHNVRIGRLCLIMAQAGIAGSARIEDGAIIAGQAGLAGHITVGAGARIGGQAGVFASVPAGETWSGYPARPHKQSLRASAAVHRLTRIIKRLEQLLDRSP